MNTTEKNKLILEFMGVEPVYNSYAERWQWSDGVFFSTSNQDKGKTLQDMANYAKYSTSWDWLLPVVEKTANIKGFFNVENDLANMKITAKIENVYNACVSFIQWYNQQPKK